MNAWISLVFNVEDLTLYHRNATNDTIYNFACSLHIKMHPDSIDIFITVLLQLILTHYINQILENWIIFGTNGV